MAASQPGRRVHDDLVHAGNCSAPTPANTSGATVPASFNTTIIHSAATTPPERARPHRSISPPTVSSNPVPPSAQYTLTTALANPRPAAIDAATTVQRPHRSCTPQACRNDSALRDGPGVMREEPEEARSRGLDAEPDRIRLRVVQRPGPPPMGAGQRRCRHRPSASGDCWRRRRPMDSLFSSGSRRRARRRCSG
jgi:hypothetical protein